MLSHIKDNSSKSLTLFPQQNIQAKLNINSPGDQYEREADAMANKIISNGNIHNPGHTTGLIGNSLQRKCASCEEEEEKKMVMRKTENSGDTMEASRTFLSLLASTKGSGSPLPQSTRGSMENAFSTDFSAVRIHTDSKASQMSKGINARAFTYGNDIYFNGNNFNTQTYEGKKLLAHELTHTRQQTGNNRIQRDLMTYNSEHEETLPSLGATASAQSIVYQASTAAVDSALSSLVASGKIQKRVTSNSTYFSNISATVTEVEIAFRTAGFAQATEMANGLMDRNNIFTFSRGRFWRSYTLFWSNEGPHREVTERQTSRSLTEYEKAEASLVFGSSLRLSNITVNEDPVMSIGGYARTLPDTIYFPTGTFNNSNLMPWLIHELTHCWQYQHGIGVGTTLWHAIFSTYNYGGEAGLISAFSSRRSFRSFNTEQQGDIVRDYYNRLKRGLSVAAWQPYITELRTGVLPP